MSAPVVSLCRRPPPPAGAPALDPAQRRVVEHQSGPLRVLAGPGTGKTTAIVEAVVARIEGGVDPERILVLTFSRRAAAQLRVRIAARVGRTIREPLARTFHSYAFGLLRRRAASRGEPAIRLISGPEQDLVIRELLAGDAGAGGVGWPDWLRPALRMNGFVAELRDLMLRALERDVSPARLAAWGRERGRDDWVAAAVFLQQYADVTALRGPGAAFDPAELIRAVIDDFRTDPTALAAERARLDWVYVDEYQDTDPAQEELLGLLAGAGRNLVVVGDPDQSIYAFRGAAIEGIIDFPERFPQRGGTPAPTVALTTCRRSDSTLIEASRRVIDRVAGGKRREHRALMTPVGTAPGTVEVQVLTSASQEAAYIAHRLRAAHLRDGVPWSEMAVLVRSTTGQLATLRRAFLSAGVPVSVTAEELPLAEQPAVQALLGVLAAALPVGGSASSAGADWPPDLDEERALALLISPLGGADALAVRRLRQQLRRSAAVVGDHRPSAKLLVEALREPGDLLSVDDPVSAPARRVAGLLAVARAEARRTGSSTEDVLWAVWRASGLGPRWQRMSAAPGGAGAAANRDLDAVVALFEAVAQFVDRLPGSGPREFLDHVLGQQIPGDSLAARAPMGESVRVLTAHGAKGLEWDLVVVAGVQEGRWPDLRVRGSLLGSEQLVDLAAGREPGPLSAVTGLRDEEWRLFYVAVTRARHHVLVTAVDSEDGEIPSGLLDALDVRHLTDGPRPHAVVPRTLSLASVVAELRGVCVDPDEEVLRRTAAGAHLARLAASGVRSADPDQWWGALALSDERAVRDPDEQVPVSPSRVEAFSTCGLRWLLESSGGSSGPGSNQSVGTLVHDAGALARTPDVPVQTLIDRLDESWSSLDLGGPWYSLRQREQAVQMLRRLHEWLQANPRELVGVELEFAATVGRAELRGRVDRLEQEPATGALVVVDLKTGSAVPSAATLPTQPQLGAYQVAVQHGGFAEHGTVSGGAELLQLRNGLKVQVQSPLADAEDPQWAETLVREVADGMAAATFVATENTYCRRCPVASSCPLIGRGRQVMT